MRSRTRDFELKADCYVAALDCQGAKRLLPAAWRKFPLFDRIHRLEGVPVITVQLRCVPVIQLQGVRLATVSVSEYFVKLRCVRYGIRGGLWPTRGLPPRAMPFAFAMAGQVCWRRAT